MSDEVPTDKCINCGHRAFWHEPGGCVRIACVCDFAPSDIVPEVTPVVGPTEGEHHD